MLPGQAVFISLRGEVSTQICHTSPMLAPCIFEYVYFSRQDSIIDGVSVYAARKAVRIFLFIALTLLLYPSRTD